MDNRLEFSNSTLADLYGPNSMPLNLLKAHEENDKLVLTLFGLKSNSSDAEILSSLFEKYNYMTNGTLGA